MLLPLALEALEQQQQREQQGKHDDGKRSAAAAPPAPVAWAMQRRWQLWGGAVALTACGRVLADKHWVSDTLAGACLGAALFSAVAIASGMVQFGVGALPTSEAPEREGGRHRR